MRLSGSSTRTAGAPPYARPSQPHAPLTDPVLRRAPTIRSVHVHVNAESACATLRRALHTLLYATRGLARGCTAANPPAHALFMSRVTHKRR
jgi:hypothetical protein